MYTTVKYHRCSLDFILGNYQEALRNLREALNLLRPTNNFDQISRILLLNFQIYIEILRFDKASEIVKELKKIKPKSIESDIKIRISLAETLLSQYINGTPDRIKIEQTYKHILSKKLVDQEFYTFALINLIEFLISEVFVNDDDKYFIEIQKYLYQLYELMTNNGSNYMRCQTLFLQYKISMAKTDLFSANLYLDQAHEVAAEYGYSSKLTEIALENLKLSQLLIMEN